MLSDAGYIDLYNKTYHVTTEIEGAKEKLREVIKYLSSEGKDWNDIKDQISKLPH